MVEDAKMLFNQVSKHLAIFDGPKRKTDNQRDSSKEGRVDVVHQASEKLRGLLANSSLNDEMLRTILTVSADWKRK